MPVELPGPHEVKDAYCLLNFDDSITTDHIPQPVVFTGIAPLLSIFFSVEWTGGTSILMRYMAAGQGTTIIAAKGSTLLGVKAAIAKSFERIHRSNPVGMRIIPHCFKPGEDACFLGLTGHERYTIDLPSKIREIRPGQHVTITTDTGKSFTCTAQSGVLQQTISSTDFSRSSVIPGNALLFR
ncbi:hypothetical protein POUND7_006771, partial [Theobroma cacao]